MPLKLMLSAAEVSGDVHGAALASELKKIDKDIKLFGMGGEKMQDAGVDVMLDVTHTSTIGILEPFKHLFSHIRSFKFMVSLLKKEKPDALIVIDAQGFHVPLTKKAKKLGIKTIYYIAPQEWLWGKENKIKNIINSVDLVVAVFEKEFEAYKKFGANVLYFGHPVVDIAKSSHKKIELQTASNVSGGAPFVGLFPGSRKQEIESLLPVMLDSIKLIEKKFGKINPLLALSSSKFKTKIENMVKERDVNLSIIEGGTYDVLAACDVSIAASGTVLLEAAALISPIIMMYKLSPLTTFIAKRILKLEKKLKFYSMPNILANEKIMPEYVLDAANAENLSNEAISILKDPSKAEKIKHSFKQLSAMLGEPGVVSRVAQGIIDFACL